MKYTYQDMPDKTLEGIKKELVDGLTIIAFRFETELGVPLEFFQDMSKTYHKNMADQLAFYMNMRNKHPKWFLAKLSGAV